MPRSNDLSSHNILRDKPFDHPSSRVTGPVGFLNPTNAQVHHSSLAKIATHTEEEAATAAGTAEEKLRQHGHQPHKRHAAYQWTSRNNRKGRHGLVLSPSLDASSTPTPPKSSSFTAIGKGILRMLTEYPYWDVSWLVAVIFTIGSVVWVFNGFFVWLPLYAPSTQFPNEISYGGGITAFIGATIFEIGSILLMIESVNEERADCFGWAVEEAVHGRDEAHERNVDANKGLVIKQDGCIHHHSNRHNFIGKGAKQSSTSKLSASNASSSSSEHETKQDQQMESKRKAWRWFPSWHELTHHYLREIGFLACSSQMFGATVFWVSGFTALPQILNSLNTQRKLDGAYWIPQIIGGTGFIVSGILFMLETQKKWYLPAPNVLGWHIGLYNLIGGIGFTLSPAFGLDPAEWAQYQAALTTFWASFFFLLGSVIQWYESQDKNPVAVGEIEQPAATSASA